MTTITPTLIRTTTTVKMPTTTNTKKRVTTAMQTTPMKWKAPMGRLLKGAPTGRRTAGGGAISGSNRRIR